MANLASGGAAGLLSSLRCKWKYEVLIENKRIQCPYCGEMIDIQIDASIDAQRYIEDCAVCCQPIELAVSVLDDVISVVARTNDE
jgi:transcription elongation factor Elf1